MMRYYYHALQKYFIVTSIVVYLIIYHDAFVNGNDSGISSSSSNDPRSDYEDWYSRYTTYPEYCSTMDQMKKREIPSFPKDDTRVGETRLLHVTSLIRHGARTPLIGGNGEDVCWEGYYNDTGAWDCNVITYTASQTPHKESVHFSVETDDFQTTFANHYDALMEPKNDLSNYLNGTCQFGQLIQRGYEQQINNGLHLRDAYVYKLGEFDHDVRMRLIDSTESDGVTPWARQNLWFRSSDTQRTKMSGEVLLQSMFAAEIEKHHMRTGRVSIPIHTADQDRDIMYPNKDICPRLTEIDDNVMKSRSYKKIDESREAKTLKSFMKEQLKIQEDMDVIDCLMPTICTDRTLPVAITDLGISEDDTPDASAKDIYHSKYGSHLFHRLTDFYARRYTVTLLENNAEYSKLAMGPLWLEIMQNIKLAIEDQSVTGTLSKFALFSGHDSTLMPMLASLGVLESGYWPNYASMLLIEVHEFVDGQTDRKIFQSLYGFRLIYDGEAITQKIKGCPLFGQLCDLDILINMVDAFAVPDRDCKESKFAMEVEKVESALNNVPIAMLCIFFTILGAVIGTSIYIVCGGKSCRSIFTRNRGGWKLVIDKNDDCVNVVDCIALTQQPSTFSNNIPEADREQFQIDDDDFPFD